MNGQRKVEEARKFATGAELFALELFQKSGKIDPRLSFNDGILWASNQIIQLAREIVNQRQECQKAEKYIEEEKEHGNEARSGGRVDSENQRRDSFMEALGEDRRS